MTCRGRGNGANLQEAHGGRGLQRGPGSWTLRLLADQAVKLELTGSISRQAGAEKNNSRPWRKKEWCIPKVADCLHGGPGHGTL